MSNASSSTKLEGKPGTIPLADVAYMVKTKGGATSIMINTTWHNPGTLHLTTGVPGSKFPRNITEKQRRMLDKGCQLAHEAISDAAEMFKHF